MAARIDFNSGRFLQCQYSVTNLNLIQARFSLRSILFFLAIISMLLTAMHCQGQEALRLSMAGDLAATYRHQYNSSLGYYNLLVGPTAWRFVGGLATEYNDNVRLQENAESDLVLRPNLNVQMHWPVSLKNSFDVSLGVGYSEYVQHQDLSQIYITPLSGLSFDVYVGDFKINVHDQINITEYAYQNPGAGGNNKNLISLQNTAGTDALWDLDNVVSSLGYDHANYLSLSHSQGQPDVSSENLFGNAGVWALPSQLLLGLEAGGSLINYNQQTLSGSPVANAVQWNIGAFASAQISQNISIRLDSGYSDYIPDSAGTNLLTSDTSGFYLSLSISHRVNKVLSYTLSAGRSTDLSAYGQPQTYYFVRLNPNLNLFNKYSLGTQFWWQQASDVYNSATAGIGKYDQYGVGFNINHDINKHLSASVYYQFVKYSGSNLSVTRYTDDIVGLSFNYRF